MKVSFALLWVSILFLNTMSVHSHTLTRQHSKKFPRWMIDPRYSEEEEKLEKQILDGKWEHMRED
ncbi:unnamed protein product [Cylicocyclus nassatus]|uniref:Uncharacterized protein n=1 Tax=Cylicocyclus nassatus TaxID=53992 RepID=A0AA36GXT7_CYLNA|nr:unnamed protein product [Cylicocyclus nassatus]